MERTKFDLCDCRNELATAREISHRLGTERDEARQQLAEARAANERRDAVVMAATAFAVKWNDLESIGLFEAFCKLMSALKAAEAGGGRG
jgi:hypothetical protein